jgi:hypothetical protein
MMQTRTTLRSNKQLVEELRTAPEPWVDAAIVVAFENRFEFVGEDHPDPMSRLHSLLQEGGLPIGLAGVMPDGHTDGTALHTQVFQEYLGQAWAHRYMDTLRGIVRMHDNTSEG